jgi:hypothetical protein
MDEPWTDRPEANPQRDNAPSGDGAAANRQRVHRIARPNASGPDADAATVEGEPTAPPPMMNDAEDGAPRTEAPIFPPGPAAADRAHTAHSRRAPSVVRVERTVDVDLDEHRRTEHRPSPNRILGWLYQREDVAQHAARPWPQVLCLTGVDYFSTLGYQPGIAFLAAGLLSPLATLILVIFTLVAALPVYRRVAAESPHGQGSIGMLERLLPRWRGKLFVLCLLGFAGTDFIVTITLSAADATAHVVENPFFPHAVPHGHLTDIAITLVLVAILGGVFLKGFKEAIGIAVLLVTLYLGLNLIVVVRALADVGAHPVVVSNWADALHAQRGSPLAMVGVSLLLFPKLALGLSGFETGVAVMPVVKGDPTDTEQHPAGRIRNTRRLLMAAALIMSVYLVASSLATTLLIPPAAFAEGGEANGRALAFLAHSYLGDIFGTAYDLSTIAILWFAGASAMAGLLNLVPRYLPGYGMAPQWATAQRPLVLVFTGIAFLVTVVFRADVDAQGSAYATGVLVLMSSASIAVAISFWRRRSRVRWFFVLIMLGFFYITVQNVHERPSGLIIASGFIVAIVVTSVVSRVLRSTELRVHHVVLDRSAAQMLRGAARDGSLRLVTHDPLRGTDPEAYEREVAEARRRHGISEDVPLLLVEVRRADPSVFLDDLSIAGHTVGPYQLLRCDAAAVANAIAALAIALHGQYQGAVHLYMRWTPINSILDAIGEGIEFLLWGGGDMARLVELEVRREALDEAIIVHAA